MSIKGKIILSCLVAAGAGLVVLQALVYNGYCVAKGGWPEEAVIYDTALRAVYDAYPPQRFRIPGVFSKKIINHIHYKDFEDFVARNPDCCSLSDTGWKGLKVDFFHKIRGYSGGFVRVEYAASSEGFTLADREKIASKDSTFDGVNDKRFDELNHLNLAFVPMTNCGKIWRGY